MSACNISSGTRIGPVVIEGPLGSGSFGEVFLARTARKGVSVALKIETPKHREETAIPQVLTESRFLSFLDGTPGIPRVVWTGTFRPPIFAGGAATSVETVTAAHPLKADDRVHAFAMELLGRDITSLWDGMDRAPLSPKSLHMLADQGLTVLERIHARGVLHRDLKPQNLLMGPAGKRLYLVDFGLAKSFRLRNGSHIREDAAQSWPSLGTAQYVSRQQEKGRPQSRRDDLEALGLVLVHLARGSLPWQGLGLKAADKRRKLKLAWSGDDLCRYQTEKDRLARRATLGIPVGLGAIVDHARRLRFADSPQYSDLRKRLHAERIAAGIVLDCVYDWDVTADRKLSTNGSDSNDSSGSVSAASGAVALGDDGSSSAVSSVSDSGSYGADRDVAMQRAPPPAGPAGGRRPAAGGRRRPASGAGRPRPRGARAAGKGAPKRATPARRPAAAAPGPGGQAKKPARPKAKPRARGGGARAPPRGRSEKP